MCVNHRNLLHFLVGQELRAIAIKKHNKQSLEAIACCYRKFGVAISERELALPILSLKRIALKIIIITS